MSGFISLHRSLLDWEWYSEPNTCRLFIHCLLKANWKDMSHRGKLVKRGNFLTSLDLLASQTGLSVRNIRTALKNLKSTNELTIKTSVQGTEITVNNYDKYQDPTSEVTRSRQASDKQVTTSNKVNKDNKEIKEIPAKRVSKKLLDRDFVLNDQWKDLALNYWSSKNRTDLDVNDQFFQFKKHHMANATKSADWQASWSTWYANAVKFNKAPFQVVQINNAPQPKREMIKAGTER